MSDTRTLPKGWRAEYALAAAQYIEAFANAALDADSSNQVLRQAAMTRIAQLASVCMSALGDEVEKREDLHKQLFGVALPPEKSEANDA